MKISEQLFYLILFLVVAMSVITFWVFYLDRRRARHRQSRIPDLVLILLALCGGSIGAILAMAILKVKTRNPQFLVGLPLIFLVEATIFFLALPW
ncbi:MAG: DUF1294 domain-containing protein [Clostridiales bacterium]|nr:DUF1294 domain-containing protein [Clostridiales bacterium]